MKKAWKEEVALQEHQQPFTNAFVYRTAAFCEFDHESSIELLRRMNPDHWNVKIDQIQKELKRTREVFPIPHVFTKAAQDVDLLLSNTIRHGDRKAIRCVF